MKLSELEQQARERDEERKTEQAKAEAEELRVAGEAREEFRQQVIAMMVEDLGMDAEELSVALSVENFSLDNWSWNKLRLHAPGHVPITFSVARHSKSDRWHIKSSQFYIGERYTHTLGAALADAADKYQENLAAEAREKAREEKNAERRAARQQEAEERGQHYLDMLETYPILRPILDLLGAVMEDRERFAEDLEAAEEFAANVEARLQKKLEMERAEATHFARERDDLQHELYAVRDELDSEQRRQRSW